VFLVLVPTSSSARLVRWAAPQAVPLACTGMAQPMDLAVNVWMGSLSLNKFNPV
jgi:hypothetical protein